MKLMIQIGLMTLLGTQWAMAQAVSSSTLPTSSTVTSVPSLTDLSGTTKSQTLTTTAGGLPIYAQNTGSTDLTNASKLADLCQDGGCCSNPNGQFCAISSVPSPYTWTLYHCAAKQSGIGGFFSEVESFFGNLFRGKMDANVATVGTPELTGSAPSGTNTFLQAESACATQAGAAVASTPVASANTSPVVATPTISAPTAGTSNKANDGVK
jgi:hypothetical protein